MNVDDVEVGTSYSIYHDEGNEMWLITKVISRKGNEVRFWELCLAGSCAGHIVESAFRVFPDRSIGVTCWVLGKAGE